MALPTPPTKKEDFLTFATTRMDLEGFMLSGTNQTQKDKPSMTLFTRGSRSSQSHKDRREKGGCRGRGAEDGSGSSCLMGTEFQFFEIKRVLEMEGGDGCTTT